MLLGGRVSSYPVAAAEVRVRAHKPKPVGDYLKLSQVARHPFGTCGKFTPYSHCYLYPRETSDLKTQNITNYIKSVDVWSFVRAKLGN